MNRNISTAIVKELVRGDVNRDLCAKVESIYYTMVARQERQWKIRKSFMAFAALSISCTFMLYLLLCLIPYMGYNTPALPDNMWVVLNPLVHPWICTFLGGIWAIIISIIAISNAND